MITTDNDVLQRIDNGCVVFSFDQFSEHYYLLKGAPLATFQYLQQRANKDNWCYPSVEKIAQATGYCRQEIIRTLKQLREFKLNGHRILLSVPIERGGDHRNNGYLILPTQEEVEVFEDQGYFLGSVPGDAEFVGFEIFTRRRGKYETYIRAQREKYEKYISTRETTRKVQKASLTSLYQERTKSSISVLPEMEIQAGTKVSPPARPHLTREKDQPDVKTFRSPTKPNGAFDPYETVISKELGKAGLTVWQAIQAKQMVINKLAEFQEPEKVVLYAVGEAALQGEESGDELGTKAHVAVAMIKRYTDRYLPAFDNAINYNGETIFRRYTW